MNRSQLVTRIQGKIERFDTTTHQPLIENWINETVKEVEDAYPFDYLKRRETAALTADTNEYTLPTNLILHHPFRLRVQSSTDADVYTHLFNMTDSFFDFLVNDATTSGNMPFYFIQRGGTNGLVFAVYPVQNQDLTMEVTEGYFYTGVWAVGGTGDTKSNWLSANHANLIVEGVCAKAYEYFYEPEKADRSFEKYNAYLNGDRRSGIYGLIPESRRRKYGNYKLPRIKTLEDFGDSHALKLRRFSI